MDLEQLQHLNECIEICSYIATQFERNKDDICKCVGGNVVTPYNAITDDMIEQVKTIQRNLVILQQIAI